MGEETDRSSKLAYFLVGGGIGAVVALLFTPRTGRENREVFTKKATDSREQVISASRNASDKMSDYIDKSKGIVSTQKDRISAALEAGKQAYQEEKLKIEPESESS